MTQHQALTRLVHVAHGDVPDDLVLPVGFTLLPGEVALWSASARLVDMVESGGDDAALDVGSGEVVVTDLRLAFVGVGEPPLATGGSARSSGCVTSTTSAPSCACGTRRAGPGSATTRR